MKSEVPALQLDDLCKSFGSVRAVNNLSLEVHPGEIVGFLGPNGAGKSTTLNMIAGLVRPTCGHLHVYGHDLRTHFKQAMSTIGVMVDTPAFYDYLSGRKNLELAARTRGRIDREQIEHILDAMGLEHRQRDKVGIYSHGMRQRLGLGRALLGHPRMLLLDEPTNGLDPEATRAILALLREKVDRDGIAVFLSSHLLYEVEEFCDRVVVIHRGRLVAAGDVKEILAPHDNVVRVTFAGRCPDPKELRAEENIVRVTSVSADTLEIAVSGSQVCQLNEYLVRGGWRVSAIVPRQRTLKDFFMSATGNNQDTANDTTSCSQ
ncbi:MAG: ABC transporter ATP-binding protein [Planctomycetota bacterium]